MKYTVEVTLEYPPESDLQPILVGHAVAVALKNHFRETYKPQYRPKIDILMRETVPAEIKTINASFEIK